MFITKNGLKLIANPGVVRATIKILVEKAIKVSLTKATLKKIPVLGFFAGLALGFWRTVNG